MAKSKEECQQAVCVFAPNREKVTGIIRMHQSKGGVRFTGWIKGMRDGKHGLHIHQYGDLTEGCESACAHFNPGQQHHGGLASKIRHLGDLGNVVSRNGKARVGLTAPGLSLCLPANTAIVGRMVVVHEMPDDLGLGGDAESLETGNAGRRIACGVIGLAALTSSRRTSRKKQLGRSYHLRRHPRRTRNKKAP